MDSRLWAVRALVDGMGVGGGNGLLPSGGVYVKIGIHRRVCAGDGSILRSIHRFLKFWHIAGNSRQRKGSWMLLFRGNIPRGVFCEWSAAKVTENPRIAARNGVFCRFCASRSVLLGTECTVTVGYGGQRLWAVEILHFPEIFLIIRLRVVSLFPTAKGGKWGKSIWF